MTKNKFLLVALVSLYSVCLTAGELIVHPGYKNHYNNQQMQAYNSQEIDIYNDEQDQELEVYNNDQDQEYNKLLPQIKEDLVSIREITNRLSKSTFGIDQAKAINHFKLVSKTKNIILNFAQNQRIDKLKAGQALLNEWRKTCISFKRNFNDSYCTTNELGSQFIKILKLELLMFHLVYTI